MSLFGIYSAMTQVFIFPLSGMIIIVISVDIGPIEKKNPIINMSSKSCLLFLKGMLIISISSAWVNSVFHEC